MSKLAVTSGGDVPNKVEAGPFRVSTARFPPDLHIPSHYHERGCVSILLSGRFEQRFRTRVCDCPPGVVLAKPPGERHVDRWFGTWSRHVIIEIDPTRHEDLGPSRAVAEEVFHEPHLGADVLAHELSQELRLADSLTPVAVEGLVLQLLAAVRRRGLVSGRAAEAPRWLLEARDYVHDNFRSSIRLSDVAEIAGVHPDSLSRRFPAVFSATVGEYVRRLRVEAAADLLANSDAPIAAIALEVGFSDQSHLTRVFKRRVGMPPGRYRAWRRETIV